MSEISLSPTELDHPAAGRSGAGRISPKVRNLSSLALDIGLSPAAYYLLSAWGWNDRGALLGSTVVAGLWAIGSAVARRRVDGLAVLMVALNGLGLVLATLSDDPRLMLAKDPAFSGLICLVMLGSLIVGRPVMFGISRRFQAAEAEDTRRWNLLWNTDSEVRRSFTVSTAVWAAGLGLDAVVRLMIIVTLPVPVAVGLMNPVQWAVIAMLFAYTMHARRRIDLGARLRAL
ncbi:VC0807 family protein [Nocardia pseudobrasiliensis]|uniref:Intracellular septation protein A n=1 Tax=Nocardia pseudobrasiliensis TaxID=45979 RepID=A0A370HW68_9NOCA|nr:VC0807 family protein [Nocardia pseudobrasiliensis]RDI62746.1 hypothetical protein DFR76_11263 [Nocardia pseudobrasiliensis]